MPDVFKIIIVTPDDQMVVSGTVHRNTYQATVTYDYATGRVYQRNLAVSYFLQFLVTFIPTLAVEGAILLLFGFSLKQNWKAFLLVNFITQVLMTAVLGTLLMRQGTITGYIIFIPLEIGITVIEAAAFSRLLKEHSTKKRKLYAVTANVVSAVMGWFLIWYEFMLQSFTF